MSSTRKAIPGGRLRQERWASNPAFQVAVYSHHVAAKCSLLESRTVRERLWFLQSLSMREGGVDRIAEEILARHGGRIGTYTMREAGIKLEQKLHGGLLREIREEFIGRVASLNDEGGSMYVRGELTPLERDQLEYARIHGQRRDMDAILAASQARPTHVPSAVFFGFCERAAIQGLADRLVKICLDPDTDPGVDPWYFAELPEVLAEMKADHEARAAQAVVVTSIGAQVNEALEYAKETASFTLIHGNCGRGKSFAARAWCNTRPGAARFYEVPATNDMHSFMRGLAQALGVPSNIKSQLFELSQRVEQVLVQGDLLLVLDEAWRLWPLKNLRDNMPARVAWLMSMVERGVPVALISTPQFFQAKDRAQSACHWNSDQFFRRFRQVLEVPDTITEQDVRLVCDSLLPSAAEELRGSIARTVGQWPMPLDALDGIARRAADNARKAGVGKPGNEHVALAYQAAAKSQAALDRLAPMRAQGQAAVAPTRAAGDSPANVPRMGRALEFPDGHNRTAGLPAVVVGSA